FSFPLHTADSRAAWAVIETGYARVTAIGPALWGMYFGGHYEAIDVLIASTAWIALVDAVVC
ncbi:hypothetical protein EK21DRAFT_18155, partial [Setomelanomma holmii]